MTQSHRSNKIKHLFSNLLFILLQESILKFFALNKKFIKYPNFYGLCKLHLKLNLVYNLSFYH